MPLSRRLPLLAVLAALLAVPARAQTEGVGYRLSPTASYVLFEDDAALDEALLYGGGLGLSFGEFFELGGELLLGQNIGTDVSDLSGLDEDAELAEAVGLLPARDVDLQRYGGELRVNLGTGALFPFVRVGTGILRFDPDDIDATRSIYLLGGAGLQLTGADRYSLSVSVENLAYRYNPATTFFTGGELADAGVGFENFNQTTVQNLAARAALQLYLGGRRPGSLSALDREFQRQFSGGLAGLSLVVEPFYGRVDFDEALAYRDQSFLGGEVGVDFGPLVGLRAFYARGIEDDDPTDFQEIQMVGGDVRLRLSDGTGLVPFLSVGGGYLDVLDDYADPAEPATATAEDRPFAVGGGGVELLVSPRLRAVAEARALLMSTSDVEDVSQPDDVFVSPFFKGGLAISLGGEAGGDVQAVRRETLEEERAAFEAELAAQERAAAEREAELVAELRAQEAELEAEIAEARAEGDSLAVARLRVERDRVRADADESAAGLAQRGARGAVIGQEVRTADGDRIVTIPLPERGELYVRYGDPGGVQIESVYEGADAAPVRPAGPAAASGALSEAQIRAVVRQTLREALADRAVSGQSVTPADVDAIERRVEDRIVAQLGTRLRTDNGVTAADLARIEERLEDRLGDQIDELRELLILQQQGLRDSRRRPVIIERDDDGEIDEDVVEEIIEDDERAFVGDDVEVDLVTETAPASFALSPAGGFAFGRGPENLLVGLHAEYATTESYRYIPEVLIGVGSRRSFVANADVAFDIPASGLEQYGRPYVRTGIGLVNYAGEDEPDATFEDVDDGGTSLTFNLGVGATLAQVGDGRFFVDFTSGNLGRFNRLTAGYRFPFGPQAY
jgi:hypothetical protein